jgi:plasmid stability protein
MMTNVTITLDDETIQRTRVAAAQAGKSVSKFVGELLRKELGSSPLSRKEAMRRFLDGPPLNILNEDGTAPTTDQLYE